MNKDHTATEERIRELVPRLKELTFGCQIQGIGGDEYVINETQLDTYVCDNSFEFLFTDCSNVYESKKKEDFKIIGHPITLEDVLDAVHQCEKEHDFDWEDVIMEILNRWQFGKDFSQQTEEAKEFITALFNNPS